MKFDREAIEHAIKTKIEEIVAPTGLEAGDLASDELISASGLIDSTGLLDLLAWYEDYFDIRLSQDEITIDNLGSIQLMTNFVLTRKGSS